MQTIAELKIVSVTYGGNTLRTPTTLTVTATPVDDNPTALRIQEGFVVVDIKNRPTRLIPLSSVIELGVEPQTDNG
jgi:hypothetical protein